MRNKDRYPIALFLAERMVFMDLGEGLKKVFLAGVGAVATTAETAKEIVDDLVTKGELTVEQGKVLNEELKRNTKQKIKDHVTVNVTREYKDAFSAVEHMNAEELAALKEEIRKAEERAEKEAQEKATARSMMKFCRALSKATSRREKKCILSLSAVPTSLALSVITNVRRKLPHRLRELRWRVHV